MCLTYTNLILQSDSLKRPQKVDQIDESSGLLMLYYDPDNKVVYLAGKVCDYTC